MDNLRCRQMLDRFLTFYDKASRENAGSERRFELWKQHYGFTYVPPGYERDQLAKEMLDYAWDKYSLVYEKIKYFESEPIKLYELLTSIKETLNYHEPIDLTVLYFVGTFETDPFIMKENEQYTLCFPVEVEWSDYKLIQELTRVVHCCKSGLAPSQTRTLGQLIFQEGIGLHTARAIMEDKKGSGIELFWNHEKCTKEPNRIMMNIIPHLNRTDYQALYSFTKGTGASGYEKEANYTGWILIKYLLTQGKNLSELAAIPNTEVDRYIENSLYSLLNHAYLTQPQE
ncbi:hypothetical protein LCL89_07610 [Halobacillus yeomjeoni]|uniref:hypothetical protein n=1 Tax=Halobacillus yeomjeoni TaxID=311194 RepID=UPI001CD4B019|nr:hypothetical protein [Halobacillus yeomjeoni]MCA0983926.1 hypothetical protein [Halobacillus yeomjeoni]